ncbi:MAG: biotin-dependent carboxyltransferase [Pseudacidovorax sp.]|uniref:5-oxoprolinase subunit C family protein n=1 Tax=Pseudacidovorax sp. TaxID=1934311 RepID=UPI001B4C242D|nr:biotin-dependent carboxyltransferase family protein [Pseudacidovorax sp.]MBP6897943.1 biotin-dependent carboxyltransferase [Pseudacidovorax sp.]
MILVHKPGLLASVQDLGREGHRQRGICPGGALDRAALAVANRLVGNACGAAGLELTMGNAELRFEASTRIALMGDDFGARLDGRALRPGWSVPVQAGARLVLGGVNAQAGKAGVRSWLAVAGGINVPQVLGSRSTDLKAGFGGLDGRALKKGDRLPLGASALSEAQRARPAFGIHPLDPWRDEGAAEPVCALPPEDGVWPLRVMPGPEYAQFGAAARTQFWQAAWRITPQSNRMGSRLEGPALKRGHEVDMLSAGVVPGTIQVPPSGQPIVLMGDAQTTGGYPRIGVVIRADLWKLAQAPLGSRLRMVEVDAAAAARAWLALERWRHDIDRGLAALGWPAAPPVRL